MSARWSAPGKLFLLGEYGVLAGGRAMVAAVDRRAYGSAGAGVASPVVEAVLARARWRGFAIPAGVAVDTGAFLDPEGNKLGLGSSAVAALLAAAVVTGAGDEATLELAIEGHRDAAGGEGSGADLAASFCGGVIATRRQPAPIEPLPARLPGLELAVFSTGEPASTPALVAAARAAKSFGAAAAQLAALAERGIEAWRRRDAGGFLSQLALAGRAMEALGKDAGVPIVTPAIAQATAIAGRHGAALKPSGAGGGDVVILFSRDGGAAEEIARSTSLVRLDLAIDPVGLRSEG